MLFESILTTIAILALHSQFHIIESICYIKVEFKIHCKAKGIGTNLSELLKDKEGNLL